MHQKYPARVIFNLHFIEIRSKLNLFLDPQISLTVIYLSCSDDSKFVAFILTPWIPFDVIGLILTVDKENIPFVG
jgi:hypothetical protein